MTQNLHRAVQEREEREGRKEGGEGSEIREARENKFGEESETQLKAEVRELEEYCAELEGEIESSKQAVQELLCLKREYEQQRVRQEEKKDGERESGVCEMR